jgi:S-adenosyl-L-methionine hydrolase (adenosine-forming)
MPVVTLTTDFGPDDSYVAAMKGAILSTNPSACIVDISHSISPQGILQAAFVLNMVYRYFPPQTIHLAVVDPGVGSQRRGIILKTPDAYFVAPDNGILSYVLDDLYLLKNAPSPRSYEEEKITIKGEFEAISITDPRFWHHPVSSTFHGRDIFAPVAASLSLGISIYELGEKISDLNVLPLPRPHIDDQGRVTGQVIYMDHFGNLVTNIKRGNLPRERIAIEIADHTIHELSNYYSQGEGLLALLGSSGYLEISLKDGNAHEFLNAGIGDEVRISPDF